MSTALIAGSFDPITLGHLDIIERSSHIFTGVIVAVSHNPAKQGMFTLDERKQMISESLRLRGIENVTVTTLPTGLLAQYAREAGVNAIVKGIRGPQDLAYEEPMARVNQQLTGIETLFLPANPNYSHISSSMVKEVARLGGDVGAMLPPPAQQKFSSKEHQ
ncbi:pantetheine-phosphate adenylyltransferase [Dermabacteraceae bacterium P13115]